MATHQEPRYQQYIYHKQSSPDVRNFHAKSFSKFFISIIKAVAPALLFNSRMTCGALITKHCMSLHCY